MSEASPQLGGLDRVGIVVPIPEPQAAQLTAVRRASGDPYAEVPPHLTLLTGIPVSDWNAVVEHVAAVASRAEPFTVRFSGTDTFRPLTPVVFARVEAGGRDCSELYAALQDGPLSAPSAFPFVPHVTLAQGVPNDVLDAVQLANAGQEWTLRADQISLYGDLGDENWTLRATFPLGAS